MTRSRHIMFGVGLVGVLIYGIIYWIGVGLGWWH